MVGLPANAAKVALPAARVGEFYGFAFFASGSSPGYTFSVARGSLPGGLKLTSDGVVSGSPEAAGVWPFTLQMVDACSVGGTQTFRFVGNQAQAAAKTIEQKKGRLTAKRAAFAHTGRLGAVAFLP